MTQEALIIDLQNRVNESISQVEKLKNLSIEELSKRPQEGAWNILECIQHLNLYGDFYLPELEKRTRDGIKGNLSSEFKFNAWGNYFVNALAPPTKEKKIKKMKTFKHMNPFSSQLNAEVLNVFLKQQQQTLNLLDKALSLDLKKIKTRTTIKFVKLRLGDTFRATIYHNQRHIIQAYNILQG